MTLEPTLLPFGETFGLAGVNPNAMIGGFVGSHPAIPPKKPYIFQRSALRDFFAFWQSGNKALKIVGDPATGKTSMVEQVHARLNWPLYMVSCNPRTEANHLIGCLMPTEAGTLKWRYGPAAMAAKEGGSLLLDELNAMDPAEAIGLNMLLEGYPITIEETGEVIYPHENFRVFATENSVQSRLTMAGRNIHDDTTDDRWVYMEADYLPPDIEEQLVRNAFDRTLVSQEVVDMYAPQMVEIANKIRDAYRKEEPEFVKPISTRALIRWARLFVRLSNVPAEQGGPFFYSLQRAFLMPSKMQQSVGEYLTAKLGTGG